MQGLSQLKEGPGMCTRQEVLSCLPMHDKLPVWNQEGCLACSGHNYKASWGIQTSCESPNLHLGRAHHSQDCISPSCLGISPCESVDCLGAWIWQKDVDMLDYTGTHIVLQQL